MTNKMTKILLLNSRPSLPSQERHTGAPVIPAKVEISVIDLDLKKTYSYLL